MTVYHRHHIVPRHAGGSDHPDNIELLTVEEHAEAHRLLYLEHGRWQDRIAWQMLSGQITTAEANLEANRLRVLGVPKSAEHRRKLSEAKKGKPMSMEARSNMSRARTGVLLSEQHRRNISIGNKGKKIPLEAIEKYKASRAKKDGTTVIFDGIEYPTQSQAARAMAEKLNIPMERARGRIRGICIKEIKHRKAWK